MSETEARSQKILSFLEQIGLDHQAAHAMTVEVERAITAKVPRLHSALTIYEAQDWLAANDPAGAEYWRAQQPNVDMIATVGEHLMVAKASQQFVFDREWQERYLRGDVQETPAPAFPADRG